MPSRDDFLLLSAHPLLNATLCTINITRVDRSPDLVFFFPQRYRPGERGTARALLPHPTSSSEHTKSRRNSLPQTLVVMFYFFKICKSNLFTVVFSFCFTPFSPLSCTPCTPRSLRLHAPTGIRTHAIRRLSCNISRTKRSENRVCNNAPVNGPLDIMELRKRGRVTDRAVN